MYKWRSWRLDSVLLNEGVVGIWGQRQSWLCTVRFWIICILYNHDSNRSFLVCCPQQTPRALEPEGPGFNSCLLRSSAVWLSKGDLAILSLSFLIYKLERKKTSLAGFLDGFNAKKCTYTEYYQLLIKWLLPLLRLLPAPFPHLGTICWNEVNSPKFHKIVTWK